MIVPNYEVPAPIGLSAGGGTTINHYHHYHIAGSVVTEREIAEMVTAHQRRSITYYLFSATPQPGLARGKREF